MPMVSLATIFRLVSRTGPALVEPWVPVRLPLPALYPPAVVVWFKPPCRPPSKSLSLLRVSLRDRRVDIGLYLHSGIELVSGVGVMLNRKLALSEFSLGISVRRTGPALVDP